MRFPILVLFLCGCQFLNAQPCNDNDFINKPGKWKKNMQGSIRNITAADLGREKTFLANLHKKISTGYNPTGLEVHYSTVWNKAQDRAFVADPFHLQMYMLRYLCDDPPKGFYVEYSSATNATIAVNQLFLTDDLYAAPLEKDHLRGYLRLFKKPEKKESYWYMGEELTDNGRVRTETWLITRNDSLPFRFLNRKEYLLLTKARLEKNIKSGEAYMQSYLDKVDKELTQPASYLSQQAIAKTSDEERFTGFVKEGDLGAFYPVQPDMTYYRKGQPKSAAQFISVTWKYSVNMPVFVNNIQQMKKALPYDYLRSLLVK